MLIHFLIPFLASVVVFVVAIIVKQSRAEPEFREPRKHRIGKLFSKSTFQGFDRKKFVESDIGKYWAEILAFIGLILAVTLIEDGWPKTFDYVRPSWITLFGVLLCLGFAFLLRKKGSWPKSVGTLLAFAVMLLAVTDLGGKIIDRRTHDSIVYAGVVGSDTIWTQGKQHVGWAPVMPAHPSAYADVGFRIKYLPLGGTKDTTVLFAKGGPPSNIPPTVWVQFFPAPGDTLVAFELKVDD